MGPYLMPGLCRLHDNNCEKSMNIKNPVAYANRVLILHNFLVARKLQLNNLLNQECHPCLLGRRQEQR